MPQYFEADILKTRVIILMEHRFLFKDCNCNVNMPGGFIQ